MRLDEWNSSVHALEALSIFYSYQHLTSQVVVWFVWG